MGFSERLCLFMFEAPKSKMKFQYLMDIFEYFLNDSVHLKMKFKFKPHLAYFSGEVAQSHTDTVAVTRDCLPSPHQTTSPPQSDVGEHAHAYVQLSHPPNNTSLNFHANFVVNSMGCHMHVLPQPPSLRSDNPPDCTVLCSSIPGSTPILNEDQAIDGVGVTQPTCFVIHEKYEWGLEHQPMARDDSLSSVHPPLFHDIFGDSAIPDFSHVSSSTDGPIVDHSQNTLDDSPSFDNAEDKSFIEHPLDSSSSFSRNTEGEHSFFPSTPLCDSSNHEDADKHPKFFDLGCHDLSTSSVYHDVDLIIINLSKTLVYDDLSIDEVETPQIIEALQPELMLCQALAVQRLVSLPIRKFFKH